MAEEKFSGILNGRSGFSLYSPSLPRKDCPPTMTQRDKMRELFRRFDGDELRVVEAYVDAERCREVKRVSNNYEMSPKEYALRLFADGVAKKWIQQ